jgi:hypothetical protein
MAKTRAKVVGRADRERFTGIPHAVMNHPDWLNLSSSAIRLLLELAKQYNSRNNGNLTAAWAIMQRRGFNSQTTLAAALSCLIEQEFIVKTREGRFSNPGKCCALYALTWRNIDECRGKELEIGPTIAPYRVFSLENNKPSPKSERSVSRNCIDKE